VSGSWFGVLDPTQFNCYKTYIDTRKLDSKGFHCFQSSSEAFHWRRSRSLVLDNDRRVPQPPCKIHKCTRIAFESTYYQPKLLPPVKQKVWVTLED